MKRLKRRFHAVKRKTARRAAAWWKAVKHELDVLHGRRAAEDALLLLVALQLAVLGVNWVNSTNPILGLRLEGQLIGQWADTDFRSQADTIVNAYENEELTVKAADETSIITLRQLGVNIDKNQVYADLLAEGRTGNVFARLAGQDLAPLGLRNVRLGHPDFNTELAQEYIATLDKKIHRAPENAYFAHQDQKAIVQTDKPGRAIDAEAALVALNSANPENSSEVVLPTKQVPAEVTAGMLEPLLPQVQAIADKPLTIAAGESRATLSPEQLVGLVVPKITSDPEDADKTVAQLTFDEAKLNAVVDGVVGKAVVKPKPTIMSGGAVIQQGASGVSTADDHSLAHVLKALVQRQTGAAAPSEAQIPLVKVDPPVIHRAAAPQTRTGSGLVRLTFDDGPGGYTNQILDILGRYNVHATFYVVGRSVPGYAGQMQRTVREGHKVCNHSYSHANLARLSRAGVQQELSSTQSAIQQTTGVTPNCFRPPYGAHNATVRSVAASLGMSVDMWSVDPRDWARPGSGAIRYRVLSGTHPGAVVLLHVLNQQTVNALPGIIEGIRAQGYTLE